jgi:hypothetical protein
MQRVTLGLWALLAAIGLSGCANPAGADPADEGPSAEVASENAVTFDAWKRYRGSVIVARGPFWQRKEQKIARFDVYLSAPVIWDHSDRVIRVSFSPPGATLPCLLTLRRDGAFDHRFSPFKGSATCYVNDLPQQVEGEAWVDLWTPQRMSQWGKFVGVKFKVHSELEIRSEDPLQYQKP